VQKHVAAGSKLFCRAPRRMISIAKKLEKLSISLPVFRLTCEEGKDFEFKLLRRKYDASDGHCES
jgi:hypothetical protein